MNWIIDYYSEEVRLEIDSLPVGIRASYARLTNLLEEFGLDLRMPHSRAMGGGLFELRPKGREGIARVFYCMKVGRKLLCCIRLLRKRMKPRNGSLILPVVDKRR